MHIFSSQCPIAEVLYTIVYSVGTKFYLQGVPEKIIFKLIFEFLSLGRVFLGVKNNS